MSEAQFIFTWVWLVSSLTALVASLIALSVAVRNRRLLKATGRNGARRRVASGNVAQETLGTVMASLFVFAGVVALITEPGDPIRAIATFALILASMVLPIKSVLSLLTRRAAVRELAAHIPEEVPLEVVHVIKEKSA